MNTPTFLPLVAAADLDSPFAWHDGEPISVRQFLADASRQAGLLPADGPMINLCTDRYLFAVAFAAALIRGQTCLLPPDALPNTLARLRTMPGAGAVSGVGSGNESSNADASHEAYGLTDDPALKPSGLPVAMVQVDRESAAITSSVPRIHANRLAAVLLTSGSTGTPTPHAKTFGTLMLNIAAEARRLAELLERPSLAGVTIVATVPPQHSYGFESSVLLAMLGGAAIDSGRPYYPADIATALSRVPRPRALVTTPFHLKALLQADVVLPNVELVLSATAPLSPQLALQAERRFGGKLIEIYGCTEAGQVATRRPVQSEVWHTFDGLQIRREPSSDADAVPAEPLLAAGGSTYHATDHAPDCFIVEGGHVIVPTPLADILQLEDATRFRLLGRANDLIHVAGRRSSLAHLDHHLNSIEGVEDGAFWMPPERVDSVVRPVAFVVAPALTDAQIAGALRVRLEAVFVPRRIVRLPSLPREATGKLTRQTLARLAAEHGLTPSP